MLKNLIPLFIMIISMTPVYANNYGINLAWFENFQDEKLIGYICEALENNKDVKIAQKNILRYRQEKNLKISKEFPTVNIGADYLLLKVPKLAIPNNDIQTNSFALPFMTIWEIDYIGKNYNEIQKGRLDIENSHLDLKYANLISSIDVASTYFNLANLEAQIKIQEKIKNFLEENYKRTAKKFKNGASSEIELNKSEELFLSEKNNLEDLLGQRAEFLTEMAYLLGREPYNLEKIQVNEFGKINFRGNYPEKLTGDIVFNRPDIIISENEAKKAGLDIKIAKKEFFPSINVFGVLVFSTFVQNFGWKGVFAALTAGAMQNIFDGGKRIFTLKKRKAEYEIAVEKYLKKHILAIKEVNDALYYLKTGLEIYKNDERNFEVENSTSKKIENAYNYGVKNYLEYIEEKNRALTAEKRALNSKNQNFINLLTLYKTVGGALK